MPRTRHHKPMVLTDDERRTLEQWTRRPTTAQRLALRSRMVLACAEGLTNRAVAKRLRVSSNSVCKWRERFRVRRLARLDGRAAARCAAQSDRRSDRRRDYAHARRPAGARDAMDHAQHGGRGRPLEGHDRAHLADVRVAVASPRHVQAVGRPAVCREGARHRRAVFLSAGSRHRVVDGRKEPGAGAGSHPAALADAPRHPGAANA